MVKTFISLLKILDTRLEILSHNHLNMTRLNLKLLLQQDHKNKNSQIYPRVDMLVEIFILGVLLKISHENHSRYR